MVVVVLALIALAVTAAVVIRDAHPPVANPAPQPVKDATAPAPVVGGEADVVDAPTEAVDMTQLVVPAADDPSFDPPTQSMPAPVVFSGSQAAAILPYPAQAPAFEPVVEPAAFAPASSPHLRPDPTRLIQTEIVIEDVARAQTLALTRLVIGLALSGAAIGFGLIGAVRGIMFVVHALSH
jgi:hypothetical protein